MSRILAIEPDPERGETLKRLVGQWVDADVTVARSADAAIAALAEHGSDLILTSALISPSDDVCLTEHLKQLPEGRNLSVLTMPPLVDQAESRAKRKGGLLSLFRRRKTPAWPTYDQEALAGRIKEALQESRAAGVSNQICLVEPSQVSPDSLPHSGATRSVILDMSGVWNDAVRMADRRSDANEMSEEELLAHCGLGTKRGRAQRWDRSDLPWLTSVRLPWGLDVQLVNISSSGLLVESGTRFMPGSSTEFRLWGPNKNLVVAGRVVRSQVATVNSLGVKYRAAAIFDKKLETLAPQPAAVTGSEGPSALADVLAFVRDQAERGSEPAALRSAFEWGILQLVTAREVRIRDVPVVQNDGTESVYFAVPTDGRSQAVLQATFEADYRPRREEFEALKKAATMAAEVLRIEDTVRCLSERSA